MALRHLLKATLPKTLAPSRFFFHLAKRLEHFSRKDILQVQHNREAAIRQYNLLHPDVNLDLAKFKGFPIFQLTNNRAMLISVDGSGTLGDKFSLAVFYTFDQLFRRHGLIVTPEMIRFPLGKQKRLHIQEVLEAIREQFKEKYGRYPTEKDVDNFHDEFMRDMVINLKSFAEVNPGMREALCYFAEELGMEIALNSGFNRAEAQILIDEARRCVNGKSIPMGFTITSSEVSNGRPDPAMLLETLREAIYRTKILFAPYHGIAVDDTKPGLRAARNAKFWAVVQIAFSSDLKIDTAEQSQDTELVTARRQALLQEHGKEKLANVIAMFPSDLPLAADMINHFLSCGLTPQNAPLRIVNQGQVFTSEGQLIEQSELNSHASLKLG